MDIFEEELKEEIKVPEIKKSYAMPAAAVSRGEAIKAQSN